MAWEFENVFSGANGGVDILFDGRDVWVLGDSQITVYGYWDEDSDYEGIYEEYYPNFYNLPTQPTVSAQIPLNEIATIAQGGTSFARYYDHVYVLDGTDIVKINIASKTVVDTFTVPFTPDSNLAECMNKLWLVDIAMSDDDAPDRQKLYNFNPDTEVWSSGVEIPTRKQFETAQIIDGKDGFVIVANFNNSSVMKFNGTTGLFVNTILVNRKPTSLYTNSDREVYVGSKNGMVSVVDQTANTSSNDYGTVGNALSLADTGTHIWAVSSQLQRIDKIAASDNVRLMTGSTEDYALSDLKFVTTIFTKLLATEPFTYQWWNGSSFEDRTVRPYIFVLNETEVQAFRVNSLYRKNFNLIMGTAMIATGPEAYYGETT